MPAMESLEAALVWLFSTVSESLLIVSAPAACARVSAYLSDGTEQLLKREAVE